MHFSYLVVMVCERELATGARVLAPGLSRATDSTVVTGPSSSSDLYAAYRATKVFGALNDLRAIAIGGVVWHHAMPHVLATPESQQSYNVLIFFVISGFAVGTLLLRGMDDAGAISVLGFYRRRAFRLLPLYYAVLALYVVLVALAEPDLIARANFFDNLPFFVTFTNNMFVNLDSGRVIFLFSWSLAYEQQFYLVWPWVEAIRHRGAPMMIASALTGGSLLIMTVAGDAYVFGDALVVLASIGSGLVLAQVLHRPRCYAAIARLIARPGGAAAALLSMIAARTFDAQCGRLAIPLIITSATLLVAAAVVAEHSDVRYLARWPWLVDIGALSYGIYMFHMLAINMAKRTGLAAHMHYEMIDFTVGFAIALGLAKLSNTWIESPIMAFGRRLEKRGQSAMDDRAAAAVPGGFGPWRRISASLKLPSA